MQTNSNGKKSWDIRDLAVAVSKEEWVLVDLHEKLVVRNGKVYELSKEESKSILDNRISRGHFFAFQYIFEQSREFFFDTEMPGYEQELEEIRKFYFSYSHIFTSNSRDIARFESNYLPLVMAAMKRLHIYAMGNPYNEKLREVIKPLELRDPNEEIDFSDVYVGMARENKSWNEIDDKAYNTFGTGAVRMALEKIPETFVVDGVEVLIFRDLVKNLYYYVTKEGKVIVPEPSEYLPYPASDALLNFKFRKNARETFELLKPDILKNSSKEAYALENKKQFRLIASAIKKAEKNGERYTFNARESEFNIPFFINCYVSQYVLPTPILPHSEFYPRSLEETDKSPAQKTEHDTIVRGLIRFVHLTDLLASVDKDKEDRAKVKTV